MPVGEFSLATDITAIPPIRTGADLASEFTLSALVGSIEQFAVLTASAGTMTVSSVVNYSALATVSSNANVITAPNKFFGISNLVLTAFNTTLTVGDAINIDPYLQLRVLPESRTLIIEQETRIIKVLEETRVNIIEGYTI